MRANLMSGSMWQGMETRTSKSQAPSLDPTMKSKIKPGAALWASCEADRIRRIAAGFVGWWRIQASTLMTYD
jgi:hypothetical protein